MLNKQINQWTRADFDALPFRNRWDEDVICDSIIVYPSKKLHDSGFRCINIAAVVGNTPTVQLSGCSDVMHIEGIGGFGDNWLKIYNSCPTLVPPKAWSMDCLAKSGFMRFFVNGHKIKAGISLSSFEVFTEAK